VKKFEKTKRIMKEESKAKEGDRKTGHRATFANVSGEAKEFTARRGVP